MFTGEFKDPQGETRVVSVRDGIRSLVNRFGTQAILDRHNPQGPRLGTVQAICHGCTAEVDVAPFLRESEFPLVAQLNATDEGLSLQAWTRLLDDEPWLCSTCLLQLP